MSASSTSPDPCRRGLRASSFSRPTARRRAPRSTSQSMTAASPRSRRRPSRRAGGFSPCRPPSMRTIMRGRCRRPRSARRASRSRRWLLRLAAMPPIDPYLGALAAFGRAARAGAASVMAHYTRFHGPMPPVEEARAIRPGRRRRRRARDARRLHARPQSARLRRREKHRGGLARSLARHGRGAVPRSHARRRGPDRAGRGDRRGGRERQLFGAVRPQRPAMVLGRAARRHRRTLARDRPARAHASPRDALSARLRRPRLSRGRRSAPEDAWAPVAAPDPRPLRSRARRGSRPYRGIRARSSPPIPARTCISPAASLRSPERSSAAAVSRSGSTPRPSTRTTTSCANCGSAISCTAAGASTKSSRAANGSRARGERAVRQRRAGRRRDPRRRAGRHSRARPRRARPRRGHARRADRSRLRPRDGGACRAALCRGTRRRP